MEMEILMYEGGSHDVIFWCFLKRYCDNYFKIVQSSKVAPCDIYCGVNDLGIGRLKSSSEIICAHLLLCLLGHLFKSLFEFNLVLKF